jgi:23S rRNA pseudouridine2605 synthase
MSERIQKVLAQAGYGSRREIERLIGQGSIVVNGKVASLGDQIDPEKKHKIEIAGKLVAITQGQKSRPRVIAYHKPVGEVTTRSDPEGRPTVFDHLPKMSAGRWISIGRLDLNTSGLLLFTNDGELANKLMHPSSEVSRTYAVRVRGAVSQEILKRLQEGVELEDGRAAFETISDQGGTGQNHWYHVTLKEGRNREVRRLWESQGLEVSRLMRIAYGPVELRRDLRQGRWMELDPRSMTRLYTSVGLDYKPPSQKRPQHKRKVPRKPRR